MKLSDAEEWANTQGITYKTAYCWFKKGILPVPSEQLPTGTILVFPPTQNINDGVALYARVFSSEQRDDLTRQLGRLVEYANNNKMKVVKSATEIGSGLNGRRPKLIRLLHDPNISTIVVEHRDRLARFGAEYIEASLAASGRRLIVVDQSEMSDDLVQDMIAVLVSFCARLYGRRVARNRAERGIKAMEQC
jgi:predicted site-specific integrase-resolvase